MLSTFYSDLEYYFNIDIKDGKIKITISKLIKIDDDNHKTDLFTMNGFGYFKNDGTIRSLYSKVKITRWVQLFFKEKFINIGTRH